MNNKVFSPQNWLKSIQSVQGQMLVAGTIAGMLPTMPNSADLLEAIKAPLDAFHRAGQRIEFGVLLAITPV